MFKNKCPRAHIARFLLYPDDVIRLRVAGQTLRYAGRQAQASPAVGFQKIHQQQQTQLLNQALQKD